MRLRMIDSVPYTQKEHADDQGNDDHGKRDAGMRHHAQHEFVYRNRRCLASFVHMSYEAELAGGGLDELIEARGLGDDVVAHRHQPPLAVGAQGHPLDGGRPVPDEREHLGPRQHQLDQLFLFGWLGAETDLTIEVQSNWGLLLICSRQTGKRPGQKRPVFGIKVAVAHGIGLAAPSLFGLGLGIAALL